MAQDAPYWLERIMTPTKAVSLKSVFLRFFEICYGHQIAAEYDQTNPKPAHAQDSYLAIWSTSGEYHGNLHNNERRE
jgi:hypothetical protein